MEQVKWMHRIDKSNKVQIHILLQNGQRFKITVNFDKHSRNKDGTKTAENEMKMINT